MVIVVKAVMAKSKVVQENNRLVGRAGVEFFRDLHFHSDTHDRYDLLQGIIK